MTRGYRKALDACDRRCFDGEEAIADYLFEWIKTQRTNVRVSAALKR